MQIELINLYNCILLFLCIAILLSGGGGDMIFPYNLISLLQ